MAAVVPSSCLVQFKFGYSWQIFVPVYCISLLFLVKSFNDSKTDQKLDHHIKTRSQVRQIDRQIKI